MELRGQIHAPAALSPIKNLRTHGVGDWGSLRAGGDVFSETKNVPAGIPNPDCRAHSVIAIPTLR
jgi:hypothetical protein